MERYEVTNKEGAVITIERTGAKQASNEFTVSAADMFPTTYSRVMLGLKLQWAGLMNDELKAFINKK